MSACVRIVVQCHTKYTNIGDFMEEASVHV